MYIYIYIDVRSTAADPSFETAMCGKRYGRLPHVSSLVEQAKRSAMPRMQWPGWRNRACPAVYAVLRTGYRLIVASTAKIATFLFFLYIKLYNGTSNDLSYGVEVCSGAGATNASAKF